MGETAVETKKKRGPGRPPLPEDLKDARRLLKAALNVFSAYDHAFTAKAEAVDANGDSIVPAHRAVVALSIRGALLRGTRNAEVEYAAGWKRAEKFLCAAIPARATTTSYKEWSSVRGRTTAEVVALLKTAVAASVAAKS